MVFQDNTFGLKTKETMKFNLFDRKAKKKFLTERQASENLYLIEIYLRKKMLMTTQNTMIPMKGKLWKPVSAMKHPVKPICYKITR